MQIENIEKNNNLELNNNIINEKTQTNFLETTLGKAINTAVDIGIRAILPEFIEDQVINIKDNLLNYGLKDGITQTIDDAIDLGKSAIGIFTGNFESVGQMQNAVQSGGLIDGISSLLDTVVDKVKKAGLINSTVANTIKQGKNVILNNIESNITSTFNRQYEAIDYANKYISNWKECFENKNFSGMEKEYTKLENDIFKFHNHIKQNKYAEYYMKKIEKSTYSVALHVRRGDYLLKENKDNFGVCSLAYYQKAKQYIASQYPNATFFVFSDDIEWCKNNLQGENTILVDIPQQAPDSISLYLMTQCTGHIIANSTFSFWGAKILTKTNSINIYPSKWFSNPTWNIPNYIPENWIKL